MIRMTSTLIDLDEYYVINKGQCVPCWLKNIKNNRDLYEEYKKVGKSKEENCLFKDDEQAKQVRFLSVLDRLGYPMDEVGTHLYKDSIIAAYDRLLELYNNGDVEETKEVERDLKNVYSNLYHMIARDEYEIGNDTFHSYISKSVGMRNTDKLDDTLKDAIFGVDYEDEDHFTQAFKIASYFARKDSSSPKQYRK